MRSLFAALLVASVVCAGCGYSFVRYGGTLGDVRTVAIQTPENDSYEPGVENIVADAMRREFLRRGAVRVTNDPEGADLVLSGSVRPLITRGRSFSSVVFTLEYEVTLEIALEAELANGGSVPIDQRALAESEIYTASADIEATRKNREEALRRIASILAGRVADVVSESLER